MVLDRQARSSTWAFITLSGGGGGFITMNNFITMEKFITMVVLEENVGLHHDIMGSGLGHRYHSPTEIHNRTPVPIVDRVYTADMITHLYAVTHASYQPGGGPAGSGVGADTVPSAGLQQ